MNRENRKRNVFGGVTNLIELMAMDCVMMALLEPASQSPPLVDKKKRNPQWKRLEVIRRMATTGTKKDKRRAQRYEMDGVWSFARRLRRRVVGWWRGVVYTGYDKSTSLRCKTFMMRWGGLVLFVTHQEEEEEGIYEGAPSPRLRLYCSL